MFCPNCRKHVTDEKFCPRCGTDLSPYREERDAQNQMSAQTQPTESQNEAIDMDNIEQSDIEQNKGIAWLSYFGLLVLVPMLARKTSKYCAHHVKQGWTLFATNIAYFAVTQILLAIIGAIFPGHVSYFLIRMPSAVYVIFSIIFNLGYIFFTVLGIMGIVYAATGKTKRLPVIGQIPWISKLVDNFYKNYITE